MFKFIIFCTVASLCVARSLNDDNTPVAVAIEDVALPKDIAVEDIIDESVQSLLTNIESIEDDIATQEGADKAKGFFARFTSTTTTTSTSRPFLTLNLSLNTDVLSNGTAMVNTSA
ncbi:uncharacterized protein LOC119073672 isoform X2 [Bradysia coprophila]|uniref:uncharacterized protein LOC119073672 isoform X2 n=1 Tax=Bradysia coprophila TaxID=38358 RepID=UPI00187DBC25|nr:uncharacterized protein LOC119073672 isoform X2 [Bradysia coprophila]